MNITADQVKKLREATGVGMMECKKALMENAADYDKAILWLRERGLSRAASKAGRTAAEGVVEIAMSPDRKTAAILELNCETDFAGRNEDFRSFATRVAGLALQNKITDVDALNAAKLGDATVAEMLTQLIVKVGENMSLRRVRILEQANGFLTSYIHMGGRIGTLVAFEGSQSDKAQELASDIAMHVAAASPRYFTRDDVDANELEQEKDLGRKKIAESGKPADMVEKILVGQMNKFYAEVCLVDQPFVKEPKLSVAKHVEETKAAVTLKGFVRFQLGEGIEVKKENFADEVAAQLKKV